MRGWKVGRRRTGAPKPPPRSAGNHPVTEPRKASEREHPAKTDAPRPLHPDAADALVDWYAEMGRDLPWRRTTDPYEILVSEIMLQQTRVETVLGRYESFLERFPTVAALAEAEVEDVLSEWSGLGYYRRARSLHALARAVVDEHGGEIPGDLDALRSLPGLGPYTAAAVGSIAFGIPVLSVDGNVGRVLCRLSAIEDDPRRAPVRRQLEAIAADAMERHPPAILNQAIMELGARVCLPRAPRCDECPCASYCEAHALGIEESIPPRAREAVHAVTELAAVVEYDDRVLLFRGQRPSLVQDMWEFPTLDSRIASSSNEDRPRATKSGLQQYLEDQGWEIRLGPRLGIIHHGMTNRRIECRVYEGRLAEEPEASGALGPPASRLDATAVAEAGADYISAPESGWFTLEEATRLPLATSARKTLQELLGIDLTPSPAGREPT